jgi:D-serine deaminase-like pyridoxal phosphate-dependent protein
MPKPGWKTVSLREETLKKLQKIYETDLRRPRSQKLTAYIDELLSRIIEREDRLRLYGFMKFEGAGEGHITIFDNMKRKSITVSIDSKGKALHCLEDNSSTCMHVGFCYAIDQVLKTLIDKGFRVPKESS